MKKCSVLFLLLLFNHTVFAQRIQITTTQTPTQLIKDVLLNSNACSNVTNVTTSGTLANQTGAKSPFGSYTQNGTNNLFSKGIIISTGYAINAGNTVNNATLSDNLGTSGDTDLATTFGIVTPAVLSDAAYIAFDFTPVKNTISFRYFLASEEYEFNKNYPCQFGDAFAFLIQDKTAGGAYKNISLIPTTSTPVGISTVHNDLSALTGGCMAVNPTYFNGYNQNPPNLDGTNFNGSTKAFTATGVVIPGHTYHIKLVIADYGKTASNRLYDSAVFIEGGSFDLAGYITDSNGTVLTGSTNACTLVAHSIILNPTYQWYHNGVAIPAPLGTSATYLVPIGDSGVYNVLVTDSVSLCVDNIASLNVVALSPPTAVSPQTFCVGATIANLVATGTAINWYASATGGLPLASTTVLVSGTPYYASQTIGLCESTRTLVNTVIGNPTPTFSSVGPICFGSVVAPLPTTSLNGITGTWSPLLINNTTTTSYTFTPNVGQCGISTTVTINVTPINTLTLSSAATTTAQTMCINTPITDITYPPQALGTQQIRIIPYRRSCLVSQPI